MVQLCATMVSKGTSQLLAFVSHVVIFLASYNHRCGFRGGAGRAAAPPFAGIFVGDLYEND